MGYSNEDAKIVRDDVVGYYVDRNQGVRGNVEGEEGQ